jgi:hypothetical protein
MCYENGLDILSSIFAFFWLICVTNFWVKMKNLFVFKFALFCSLKAGLCLRNGQQFLARSPRAG